MIFSFIYKHISYIFFNTVILQYLC
ncbi:hypothetical protein PBNK65NY_000507900 [Plasmodium berghei]|uniref:Uncharacterized protein n=1 Tax=Plasmodium berghei TaxID=5821 RepID=A0A1C6WEC0_PLABE|nr:hypothetical protein PBNK65NY_000507900 [Plasmodium berghei]